MSYFSLILHKKSIFSIVWHEFLRFLFQKSDCFVRKWKNKYFRFSFTTKIIHYTERFYILRLQSSSVILHKHFEYYHDLVKWFFLIFITIRTARSISASKFKRKEGTHFFAYVPEQKLLLFRRWIESAPKLFSYFAKSKSIHSSASSLKFKITMKNGQSVIENGQKIKNSQMSQVVSNRHYLRGVSS